MDTLVGTHIGSFSVTAVLGAGGMGEVYRAHDLKLERDVALKILPQAWLADPDRRARFEREARLLAALNHPNVAAIYGIEESAGRQVLVLELVDGATLAERVGRRPLDVADALGVARQIAEALAAAHDRGIVHRDLKPANVKVTTAGVVKVLDFGIAKMVSPLEAAASNAPALTTMTTMTGAGVVIGTAAYMSPEQARGLPVDKRTDVWAFGCVLFEMLTGGAAFGGATGTDVLAAVLEREPDWTRLPAAVPDGVRRLLRRCLTKDPALRLRDMGDIRVLLDDAAADPSRPPLPVPSWRRAAWVAAGATIAAAGMLGVWSLWGRATVTADPVRLSIWAPGLVSPQLSGAISPDGRQVAFVATGPSGKAMLWIRSLDSLDAREVPGTERAAHPFWSPDGRSIGFIANAKLNVVDLAGGPVQALADTRVRGGSSWNHDGVILFTQQAGRLASIPASGGAITPVFTADPARHQFSTQWPDFLPDGRHFLFFVGSDSAEFEGVYAGSLDSTDVKLVLRSDMQAKYAPPGYLLFMRDGTLMAQPFDARSVTLSGTPVPIADGVWFFRGAAHASFSVSRTGALTYVNASNTADQLAWFDRHGRPMGPVGGPDRYAVAPQLSPDASKIAVGRGEFDRADIWLIDAATGAPSRITFSPGVVRMPVWSADGRRLMVQSAGRIAIKDLASGTEEVVYPGDGVGLVDWSRDGAFAVLQGGNDIWVLPLTGDRKPVPYLQTPVNETQPQIAPDGKWIAYTSNESGRDEVYVQSFPKPGAKHQISPAGGAMPRWRGDGKELFYLAANQFMTAVPVEMSGPLFSAGDPVPLFRTKLIVQGSEAGGLPMSYAVTSDGARFLLDGVPEDPGPPMTVILNWPAVLRR